MLRSKLVQSSPIKASPTKTVTSTSERTERKSKAVPSTSNEPLGLSNRWKTKAGKTKEEKMVMTTKEEPMNRSRETKGGTTGPLFLVLVCSRALSDRGFAIEQRRAFAFPALSAFFFRDPETQLPLCFLHPCKGKTLRPFCPRPLSPAHRRDPLGPCRRPRLERPARRAAAAAGGGRETEKTAVSRTCLRLSCAVEPDLGFSPRTARGRD